MLLVKAIEASKKWWILFIAWYSIEIYISCECAQYPYNLYRVLGLSLRSLRSRFAFLKALNSDVERLLLPVTDLRAADTYNLSTATLLREGRGLLFYHTKVALLNHVLNHTSHRGADDSPPEVSLDPLEALEGVFIRITFGDIKSLKPAQIDVSSQFFSRFREFPSSTQKPPYSSRICIRLLFPIVCYGHAFPRVDRLTGNLLARGFYRRIIVKGQSRWKPSGHNPMIDVRIVQNMDKTDLLVFF